MAVTKDTESPKNPPNGRRSILRGTSVPLPKSVGRNHPHVQYSQVPTGQSVNRSVPLPQVKGPPRKSPSTQSGQVQSNHQQPELWIHLSVQYRSGGSKIEQNSCCLNQFLE